MSVDGARTRFYTANTVRWTWWGLLCTFILCGTAARPAAADPPLADLERLAAENPYNPTHAYDLALATHAAHDLPLAIERYRVALRLDPSNSLIHTSLQTALREQGLVHDALAQYEAALSRPDQAADMAFNLALASEKQGLIEEALHQYGRYVTLAPDAEDRAAVADRMTALARTIQHRRVTIRRLVTRPADVRPGDRVSIVCSYTLRGWGKRNRTGVVERVSLYRDGTETHRFAQRAIRRDNKTYKTVIDIAVPPDAAPGTYELVAEIIAGSRRAEQLAVFTIDPPPYVVAEIPDMPEEEPVAAPFAEPVLDTEPMAPGLVFEEFTVGPDSAELLPLPELEPMEGAPGEAPASNVTDADEFLKQLEVVPVSPESAAPAEPEAEKEATDIAAEPAAPADDTAPAPAQ